MPQRVNGVVVTDHKIQCPARVLISGSSGVGKTMAIEMLIRQSKFSHEFTKIYYFQPTEYDRPNVDWHKTMDIEVIYSNEIPDAKFWDTVEKDSLCVFDDLWYEVSESAEMSKAFKVHSRKKRVTLVVVTQNFYESTKYRRNVRNNCNYFILFNNHGDKGINERAATQLGFKKEYKLAAEYAFKDRFGFILIDASPDIENEDLRVQTYYLNKTIKIPDFDCNYSLCFS